MKFFIVLIQLFMILTLINSSCLDINTDDELIIKEGILKYSDIQYVKIDGIDPKFNTLDIYTKRSEELMPIMIYAHGGAWRTGNKQNVGLKPNVFLKNN